MNLAQTQTHITDLRLEQSMTFQQIQALELLTTPVLELQTMVQQEVEKNPVLEAEEAAENIQEIEPLPDNDEWLEQIMKLEEDSRYVKSSTHFQSAEDAERTQFYLDSIAYQPSEQQSLCDQLRMMDLEPNLAECCDVVLAGLNDNGYLSCHPADLAMVAGESMETVEHAIRIVQTLEPAGIGASDLRERLMIQLERDDMTDSLLYRIIDEQFDDLANNRLPMVARRLKQPMAAVQVALDQLRLLNPHIPMNRSDDHAYVQEEVTVVESSGKLSVTVNNAYLPSLYISKKYRQMLSDATVTKDTKQYIKEKIRSGVFLINSIIQRQNTIHRIATAIVDMQEEFFHHGSAYLKPMTMAQVADSVSVHETTVSRAVAGKYLSCKYGLLPLRNFFSTGYETEGGKTISNSVVKDSIRDLVGEEDPCSPLSDSQIVAELKSQGLNVARRTVAKYRKTLNILPSNLRRQYAI